jgi:hypothetical protein
MWLSNNITAFVLKNGGEKTFIYTSTALLVWQQTVVASSEHSPLTKPTLID